MKRLTAAGFVLSVLILTGSTEFAAAQMNMAENAMFVAQLDAKQVVGGSSSNATGTGAFLLDGAHKTLAYNLTYEGLSSGGAKSIALYNFGRGKNGEMVRDLCGGDAKPCPKSLPPPSPADLKAATAVPSTTSFSASSAPSASMSRSSAATASRKFAVSSRRTPRWSWC